MTQSENKSNVNLVGQKYPEPPDKYYLISRKFDP